MLVFETFIFPLNLVKFGITYRTIYTSTETICVVLSCDNITAMQDFDQVS